LLSLQPFNSLRRRGYRIKPAKEESHEKVSGFVPNGHGGNAKDDGEYEC
jgi:hypothetical protein